MFFKETLESFTKTNMELNRFAFSLTSAKLICGYLPVFIEYAFLFCLYLK
ncbi:hypothetical protein F2N14_05920 [Campylobacter novaezeelandiae]|nr:hypothetical protein [Campylobacter novaezeelandiae]